MGLTIAGLVTFFGLVGCGGDSDTTAISSSTDKQVKRQTTASTLGEESLEAAIATFTHLGFDRTQARCLVEHMSDISDQIGSTDALTAEDQTKIEELMKVCEISDTEPGDTPGG